MQFEWDEAKNHANIVKHASASNRRNRSSMARPSISLMTVSIMAKRGLSHSVCWKMSSFCPSPIPTGKDAFV